MPASPTIITRALFAHNNHFGALLPFNLNWSIRLGPEEVRFLNDHPMSVWEVGARGQAPEELESFYPHLQYSGFDADEVECARLNAAPHRYRTFKALPYFIGATVGSVPFHLYFDRGNSSVYMPDERYQSSIGGEYFRVEKTVQVKATTLDRVLGDESLPIPDFLKLDTQGSELSILRNAEAVLSHTNLVEVEVEFVQMYKNQPLFHEVMEFFQGHGFELLFLNRVFCQRAVIYKGASRGQPIFGDALFGRREDKMPAASTDRLIKYILLLINYGHIDLAYQLYNASPEVSKNLPSVSRYFENTRGSTCKRFVVSQIDKIAMLWLHQRKYNHLQADSDRSWPVR